MTVEGGPSGADITINVLENGERPCTCGGYGPNHTPSCRYLAATPTEGGT